LKHGSRMDVKDVDGRTPLMLAQSMRDGTTNREMVALLMEKEAVTKLTSAGGRRV